MNDNPPHLLVVDDDRDIRDLLARFLSRHGYRVTTARDGRDMLAALADWRIDLVILDLMLPGEDGLSLCRRVRARSEVPIIMLTAMGEDVDRIIGLEMGADDYMAKPFNPRELLARIKAVLRRATSPLAAGPYTVSGDRTDAGGVPEGGRAEATGDTRPALLRFDAFALDPVARVLTDGDGRLVELSTGEFDLLLALVTRPGRVLSRDQLLDLTRGRSAVPFDRSIDIQVSRLRRKIEPDPHDPRLIKTVRGGGYLFAVPVTRGD